VSASGPRYTGPLCSARLYASWVRRSCRVGQSARRSRQAVGRGRTCGERTGRSRRRRAAGTRFCWRCGPMTFDFIDEPELEFGAGGRHIDIRFGIMDNGPADVEAARAPKAITVGIIGTPANVE